jgi:2-dehydropantoate 2-reductase
VKFAVLGPGGVGGLLAALLARAGDPVVVLASDGTARAIARDGLRVESLRFGDFTASVATATLLSDPVDVVLVTVKATQLDGALARVPADALDGALVIPFLNGLEHVDRLREVYPPGQVVGATIRIETTRIAPTVIRHTSPFAAIDLFAADGAEEVGGHLRRTGLDVRLREDELAMLWDKFALLAPLALLTTHERANVGAVRARRRDDAAAMIGEIAAIAAADGVAVDPEQVLRVFDAVPDAMETSMQRDQEAGRPIELDALGGALLRRASRAGVEAPVTERLVAALARRTGPPEAEGRGATGR